MKEKLVSGIHISYTAGKSIFAINMPFWVRKNEWHRCYAQIYIFQSADGCKKNQVPVIVAIVQPMMIVVRQMMTDCRFLRTKELNVCTAIVTVK